MKRLILAINPLIGCGKSAFTQVFEGMLTRKGISYSSVTTVEEHASNASELWDMEEELDADQVVGFLEEGSIVVFDAPIRDAEQFIEFSLEVNLPDMLADEDAELTVVIPVSDDTESVERMVKLAEDLADSAQYVAIHEVDYEDSSWDGSYAEKVMGYLGAAEVEMPGIEEDILNSIVESHEMTISQALAERKMLPRFIRDGVHRWELDYSEKLDEVVDILVPDDAEDRSVYASR